MARFFGDLMHASIWGQKPLKTQYIEWTQKLDEKIRNIHQFISSLPIRVPLNDEQLKQISALLAEVENFLQNEKEWLENSDQTALNTVRNLLLEFWARLVEFLSLRIGNLYESIPFLNVIFRIMNRFEFDPFFLKFIDWKKPQHSEECLCFIRYCNLISQVKHYITKKLSERAPENSQVIGPRNIALYTAFARILVLNFFQFPEVHDEILKAVSLDSETDLWNFLPPSQPETPNTNAQTLLSQNNFNMNIQSSNNNMKANQHHSASVVSTSSGQQNNADIVPCLHQPNLPQREPGERIKLINNKPKPKVEPLSPIQLDNIFINEYKLLVPISEGQTKEDSIVSIFNILRHQKRQEELEYQEAQKRGKEIEQRSRQQNQFQGYFGWEKLHYILSPPQKEKTSPDKNLEQENSKQTKPWIAWFNKGDSILFVLFLQEWIYYVNSRIINENQRHQRNLSSSKGNSALGKPISKKTASSPSLSPSFPLQSSTVVRSMTESKAPPISKQKNEAKNESFCLGTFFDWNTVPGFSELVKVFLYQLKRREYWNKPFTDCSITILKCVPNLLNFYIKALYTKTNAYDLTAVNETLSRIGDLFGALQKAGISLPLSFDMDYFCSGLDIIIDTEHHQLIAKLISVIYNHADVFVGYHRKKLFIDFFITKYFFKFFLHWDESVRNYFHQLIIFKMVRIKRSELHKIGFRTPELSQFSNNTRSSNVNTFLDGKSSDLWVDIELYGNICVYLKVIEEQCRSHFILRYDPQLEVYVPQAMYEYRFFLSRYYQWESQNANQPPSLVTMSMLKERPPVVDTV